jgi:hypothetical protein
LACWIIIAPIGIPFNNLFELMVLVEMMKFEETKTKMGEVQHVKTQTKPIPIDIPMGVQIKDIIGARLFRKTHTKLMVEFIGIQTYHVTQKQATPKVIVNVRVYA